MDLPCAIRASMEKHVSIVNVWFDFSAKRPYCGMVHNREPRRRWQEHWRAILQHASGMATEKEFKCAYMSQHRSAVRWRLLPYISCGQVIAVQKLQALEHAVIVQYPNSLNRIALGPLPDLWQMANERLTCMIGIKVTGMPGSEATTTVHISRYGQLGLMAALYSDTI